jgi:hypothetical protein
LWITLYDPPLCIPVSLLLPLPSSIPQFFTFCSLLLKWFTLKVSRRCWKWQHRSDKTFPCHIFWEEPSTVEVRYLPWEKYPVKLVPVISVLFWIWYSDEEHKFFWVTLLEFESFFCNLKLYAFHWIP